MRLNTSVGNINLLTDNLRSALQISGTRLTITMNNLQE